MKLAIAIVLLVSTGSAFADKKAPTKVAVCPHVPPIVNVPFWENEELWPGCPIGSPVSSNGGRCLDGTTTCMKPCAMKMSGGLDDSATYTYDAGGRLIASTLKTVYGAGKPKETTYTCKRDKDGHRTSCTRWEGDVTYQYKDGALTGTVTMKDGKQVGMSSVKRDKKGRVIETTWQSGPIGPYTDTMTYNADGSLAKSVTTDKVITVTKTFTYDKGRLVKMHLDPKAPKGTVSNAKPTDFTYTYDAAGRLTEEKSGKGTYSYSYDADGRLVSQKRDDGIVTTYEYVCK